ncbi:MAG: hypothetical protein JSU85_04535 [Candidatus Zixiibacteriota bacterium]|nr:MAG: hypothetical protein JSU85_04535 [candidate division Zixibacteria bacterium]
MKKRLIIPLSLLAAAILISLISFSGCGNLEIEGPELENIHPWVKWAIVPSDSMVHSFNPVLNWFGGDQDGQINDYIYGVFKGDYMDSVARESSLEIPDTLTWISLGAVTEATIPLVASPDSSETIGQYVVLMAIDDAGDSSLIINRYLYRTNNRPTCIVTVPDEPEWVLPETTSTWSGIAISWEGGDSLDYTGAQPDFLWEVAIYGPYADSASAHNDTADFNPSTAPLWYTITDDDENPNLIEATSYSLTNLITGFYIVYVRNFDDANVPSRPALGIFEVYEPHWIRHPDEAKDILIVDHNNYRTWWGELRNTWQDSVNTFFENILSDAGFSEADWDWSVTQTPPISTLYMYRMVLITDVDWTIKISMGSQEAFPDYLDVGGKLWVIGRGSFNITSNTVGRVDYGPSDLMNPLAYTYMGISAAIFHEGENDDSTAFSSEFSGAYPISAGFPSVIIDTVKTLATSWEWPTGGRYYEFRTLPCVEYLITDDLPTETIYLFNSSTPDTSTMNLFPVGVRYENSTFKTSYFSFHLFFLFYDDALAAAEKMFEWFLEE